MKRSGNLTWSQVRVGIFIAIALLLAAIAIIFLGNRANLFSGTGELVVVMKDAAGLKVGAPVWLAGVEVGVVKGVHFDQKTNEVEVVVEVDREMLKKIGRDSVIMVKARGLLGEKYLDITPSRLVIETPETRLYGTSVTRIDEVMEKAGVAFDRLNQVAEKMNRGEGSLGRLTTDARLYDNLARLSQELTLFMQTVNRGEGTLGRLARSDQPYNRLMNVLGRAEQAMEGIQSTRGTLGNLIHDRQLYDKLLTFAAKSEQAATDLQELNRRLASSEGSLGRLINDSEMYDRGMELLNRADRSLKSTEELLARMNRGEGTAGKLVNERELYDKLNRLVDDLNVLVKDIKENPKRYVEFSLF